MTPINRHTQWRSLSVPIDWRHEQMACSSWQSPTVHRRCHFSSTPSLGGGRARVDSLDLRLSASVARQAQTTVSAIGGLRLAAPCSVAAASARGCGNGGVRDQA